MNSLIDKNRHCIKKELSPTLPDGEPVVYHSARNAEDEAAWIISQMKELHENGVAYRDMTVFYRARYIMRSVEEPLECKGNPVTMI